MMVSRFLDLSLASTLVVLLLASVWLLAYGFSKRIQRYFQDRYNWNVPPVEDADGVIRFQSDTWGRRFLMGSVLWTLIHLLLFGFLYPPVLVIVMPAFLVFLWLCIYASRKKFHDIVLSPAGILYEPLRQSIKTDRLAWNEIESLDTVRLKGQAMLAVVLKDRTRTSTGLKILGLGSDLTIDLTSFKNTDELEKKTYDKFETYKSSPVFLWDEKPALSDAEGPARAPVSIIAICLIAYLAVFGCNALIGLSSPPLKLDQLSTARGRLEEYRNGTLTIVSTDDRKERFKVREKGLQVRRLNAVKGELITVHYSNDRNAYLMKHRTTRAITYGSEFVKEYDSYETWVREREADRAFVVFSIFGILISLAFMYVRNRRRRDQVSTSPGPG